MGCLLRIVVTLVVTGIAYAIFGWWGILVGVLVLIITEYVDVFDNIDRDIDYKRDNARMEKQHKKEQAKRAAEKKRYEAQQVAETDRAVSIVNSSIGASRLLRACLSDFPFPYPKFYFEPVKATQASIPTVTISGRTELAFEISASEIKTDEHTTEHVYKYSFIFSEHGFSDQPDQEKRERLLRAFVQIVTDKYMERYPEIKAEALYNRVKLSTEKHVPNPNYNKQSW